MLDALFTSAAHAIVVTDQEGVIHAVNPAAEEMFGHAADEIKGQNVRILMTEPYQSKHDGYMHRYSETGKRQIIGVGREIEARRKDGSTFPIYISISEFQHEGTKRFAGIIRDLTEQAQYETELELARDRAEKTVRQLTRTQDQLIASQKLAALGELTAGIAHEIKNPLNFVSNFSETSIELLGELNVAISAALGSAPRQEIDELMADLTGDLEKIRTYAHRADGIVRSMLDHARGGEGVPVATDINELVEEAFNLAYHGQRARDKSFQLQTERLLDGEAGKAVIRRQDIIRALVNIMGNAFYAVSQRMKAGDTGYSPSVTLATLSRGKKVEIRVRDNGAGIDEEDKAKLFEPFFTTKPAGDGTGLGLSLCFDIIVHQHGGTIQVESNPGLFTEFCDLPASEQINAERSLAIDLVSILIVDDEPDIVELFRRQFRKELRSGEYVMHFANSAEEALELLDKGVEPEIMLILSDINMPGMSGIDLLKRSKERWPDLFVAMITAYGDEETLRDAMDGGASCFLSKPIDFSNLKNLIAEMRAATPS